MYLYITFRRGIESSCEGIHIFSEEVSIHPSSPPCSKGRVDWM